LGQEQSGPCVSCFLPTHRNPSEKKEDRMRLKNLLNEAERRLAGRGMRSPQVRALLEPARDLLNEEPFWETLRDGLAFFRSASLFRVYTVSIPIREFLDVGDRFHLKPLLPVLRSDGRFYLLGLSQERVILLEGTRESLVELAVPDLPRDLASALHVEQFPPEHTLELRTQTSRAGGQGAIFHGHAEEYEDVTRYLREYFRQVDRAVTVFLRGSRAPLLLAAVDYLHPLYAEANRYPHLLRSGVHGNPEVFNVEELHRRAWSIVESTLDLELDRALFEYSDLGGGPRSSEEPSTILVGAYFGRIGRLFVAEDTELWGRFDPNTLSLSVHPTRRQDDVELLDWAAIRTVSADGAVYVVPRARVPGGGPMAALFRF
jgi:hypothetical protein